MDERLPEAIIFDLDDTILDDTGSMEACWREICRSGAARIGGTDPQTLMEAISRQRDWFWSDPDRHREGRMDLRAASRGIVERALLHLGFDRPEVAREIAEGYRDLREERLCLVPGAVETLERLRAAGVALGLITNGSAAGQRAKVERFGLAAYFEHILIEGEFGLGKPHREVYEATLQALACDSVRAWSVGDNLEWDVSAPQKLGVFGVWVDVAGAGLPEGERVRPDRTVRSVAELLPTD